MEAVRTLPVNQIPPTPKGHWLVGNGPEASRNPLEFYERVWREHGDVVRLRALGGFRWYLVTHPEGAERILQTNQSNYRKAKMLRAAIIGGAGTNSHAG